MASSRIVLGMGLYNNAGYLPAALASLQAQTQEDFLLLCVDDGSSDATEAITREAAARDPRVVYLRNQTRRGNVGTWRRAFAEAQERGAELFAWTSDHDVWEPEWLSAMQAALADPAVVLAYPLIAAIDGEGRPLPRPTTRFDTTHLAERRERAIYTCTGITGAGNMIYGLMRAEAIAACGSFPRCSLPDRLLILLLALLGQFKQVQRPLWRRRYLREDLAHQELIEHQRRSLYPPGEAPLISHVPLLGQATGLIDKLALRPPSGSRRDALLSLTLARKALQGRQEPLAVELRRLLSLP